MPRLELILLLAFAASALALDERVAGRYRAMLESRPAEGAALERLWDMYKAEGRSAELLGLYAGETSFAGHLVAGWLHLRAGQLREAEVRFEAAAALKENDPRALLGLAKAAADPAKKRRALSRAAELAPTAATLSALAAAAFADGDREAARQAWVRAAESAIGDAAASEKVAGELEAHGYVADALAIWKRLAGEGDAASRATAWTRAASLAIASGDAATALDALGSALALLGPRHWMTAGVRAQLFRVAESTGRLGALREEWEASAAARPRDRAARERLVALLQFQGDLDAAIVRLGEIAALDPKDGAARLAYARALVEAGRNREAAAEMEGWPRGASPDEEFARAELEVKIGRIPAARQRIESLVSAAEDDAAIRGKALAFFEKWRMADAAEALWRSAPGDDPEVPFGFARFLLAQGRAREAAEVLDAACASAPLEGRGTVWGRAAALLGGAGAHGLAAERYRRAAEMQPDNEAWAVALAEALEAAGRREEAGAVLAALAERSPTEANDLRWFQFLEASLWVPSGMGPGAASTAPIQPALPGSALGKKLAELREAAEREGSADALLRAARWHGWARETAPAIVLATAAAKAAPGRFDAWLLIAEVTANAGRREEAIRALERAIALGAPDPRGLRRKIALHAAELERFDQATEQIGALLAEEPGDVPSLEALATVQARADLWFDALATWERVAALSKGNAKREAIAQVLRVQERLEMQDAALDTALAALDGESDPVARESYLGDLLALALRYGKLPWLIAKLSERSAAKPGDKALGRARVSALKLAGRLEEAAQVATALALAGPEDRDGLAASVEEAQGAGDLGAALAAARRLALLAGDTDAGPWKELARLQELNLDIPGALATWRRALRVHPRDPGAHLDGGRFAARWGFADEALAWFRKARGLDPGNPAPAAEIMAAAAGDEALGAARAVVELSKPIPAETPFMLPTDRMASARDVLWTARTGWPGVGGAPSPAAMGSLQRMWGAAGPEPDAAAAVRLAAIAAVSRELAARGEAGAVRSWLARWPVSGEAGGKGVLEGFWARFHAGDAAGTAQILETAAAAVPGDGTFAAARVWAGLKLGEWEGLRAWLLAPERSADERDTLPPILARYLQEGGDARAALGLFDDSLLTQRALAWRCAAAFAGANRPIEGADLALRSWEGERVRKPLFAADTARLLFLAGRGEDAMRVMREACAIPGGTSDHPAYGNLVAYWRLLPGAERGAFVADHLAETSNDPLHAATARLLFDALGGRRSDIARSAEGFLSVRSTVARAEYGSDLAPSARAWIHIRDTGHRLSDWGVPEAAGILWEKALAGADVAALDEEARPVVREIEVLAAAARIARTPGPARDGEVAAWVQGRSPEDVAKLAAVLGAIPGVGARVWDASWGAIPPHVQGAAIRTALADLALAPVPRAGLECATRFFARAIEGGDPAVIREAALRAAELAASCGLKRAAADFLERATRACPGDPSLAGSLAGALREGGREREATEIQARLAAAGGAAAIAFAEQLVALGRSGEAEALLAREKGAEADTARGRLAAGMGKAREAVAEGLKLLTTGHRDLCEEVAAALQRGGKREEAARLRVAGALSASGAEEASAWARAAVSALPAEHPFVPYGIRWVAGMARANPAMAAAFADWVGGLGISKEAVKGHLERVWADGAGPFAAGVKLAQFHAMTGGSGVIRSLLAQLADHPGFHPAQAAPMAAALVASGQEDAAFAFCARVIGRGGIPLPEVAAVARAFAGTGKAGAASGWVRNRVPVLAMGAADEAREPMARAAKALGDRETAVRIAGDWVAAAPAESRARALAVLAEVSGAGPEAFRFLAEAARWPGAFPGEALVAVAGERSVAGFAEALESCGFVGDQRADAWARYTEAAIGRGANGEALAAVLEHPEALRWHPALAAALRPVAAKEGKIAEFCGLLDGLKDESPEPATIRRELALALLEESQAGAAIVFAERAWAADPSCGAAAKAYAAGLVAAGDTDGARRVLAEFVQRAPTFAEMEEARKLAAKIR